MTTTSEAVELFLASLRTRSAPANTIKSYAHDLTHFVQAVPTDLTSVSASAIQSFLDGDGHHTGFQATSTFVDQEWDCTAGGV